MHASRGRLKALSHMEQQDGSRSRAVSMVQVDKAGKLRLISNHGTSPLNVASKWEDLTDIQAQSMVIADVAAGLTPAGGDETEPRPEAAIATPVSLVDIGLEAELFHNSSNEACATFMVNGRRQSAKVLSPTFRQWLRYEYYRRCSVNASRAELAKAQDKLDAVALFGRQQSSLHLRVAEHRDALYLDLANEQGQVVRITADGVV